MKYVSTVFLRLVIIAMTGIIAMFAIFLLPNALAVAARDYSFAVALAAGIGMYAAAVPFFWALFKGWRLLTYIDKNKVFSKASIRALAHIKYAAVAASLFFTGTLPLFYVVTQDEDAPGLMVIGLAITGAPFVIGVFAALMQRLLQNAVDIKSENDLTV